MPETDGGRSRCIARYETGRCLNLASGERGLCGPCADLILREPDPARRRALAGVSGLRDHERARLVADPDPGVRARLATRDDLDPALVSRFADPARESSPIVWRALAATPAGARHATTLLGGGDRLTLLILATNPATDQTILDLLARHDDPDVRATVAATRSGQAPDGRVISEILGARAVPTRPLAAAPPGTRWPGPPDDTGRPSGNRSSTVDDDPHAVGGGEGSDEPARHRGLLAGFAVVLVVIAVVVIVLAVGPGSSPDRRTATRVGPRTRPSTTTTDGTTPHTTVSTGATTTTVTDGGPPQGVTVEVTMTAQHRRFCGAADLRITFGTDTASVSITDDHDRDLWQGLWRSGDTRTIELPSPTTVLRAEVTALADARTFRPSGAVDGTFC